MRQGVTPLTHTYLSEVLWVRDGRQLDLGRADQLRQELAPLQRRLADAHVPEALA